MRDPKPADKECMPRHPAVCPGAAPHSFSQYGQVAWLRAEHFRYLPRPGVFVDLATNHPIHISNGQALGVGSVPGSDWAATKWRRRGGAGGAGGDGVVLSLNGEGQSS